MIFWGWTSPGLQTASDPSAFLWLQMASVKSMLFCLYLHLRPYYSPNICISYIPWFYSKFLISPRSYPSRTRPQYPYSQSSSIFPQQQNFAMGSLAQISSGAIRCSFNTRFRARFWRVPEGSGGFRCRYLLRFRRVPVQIPGEVLGGSGADLVRFQRVSVQIAGEVAQGSGAGTR